MDVISSFGSVQFLDQTISGSRILKRETSDYYGYVQRVYRRYHFSFFSLLPTTVVTGSRAVGRVISSVCDLVCLSVCPCSKKWLELSTLNSADIQRMVIAQHALTVKLKGQRSRSRGYQMRCLPALVRMHVDRTALVF